MNWQYFVKCFSEDEIKGKTGVVKEFWEEILISFPYLEKDDIKEALAYAAWRAEEIEIPFAA